MKVYVGLPDLEAREEILGLNLMNGPLADDVDLGRLAAALAGFSGADLRRVAEKAFADSFLEEIRGGGPAEVGMEQILVAAKEVKPSVGEAALARYAEWAER